MAVVGGGHNGLVAAGYLAGAGLRVVVLEQREIVGGPCSNREWFPGYRYSYSNSPGSLEPKVVQDLELERFGLHFTRPDPTVVMPFPDGRYFAGHRDRAAMAAELRKFSAHDATAYYEILDYYQWFAERLAVSLFEPPPSIAELAARMTTPADEEAFGRILFGSIQDMLDGWLESDEIKAVLASLAVGAAQSGPRTPGTAYPLLHRPLSLVSIAAKTGTDPRLLPLRGSTGLPVGGMGAITQAMERSIVSRGAVVRTGTRVLQILAGGDGAARGIVLEGGEEIRARIVASNLNPKLTLLDLVPSSALDPHFRSRVEALVMAGNQFKVVLALDGLPRFRFARDEAEARSFEACQFRIAPSLDYMERAWDDAKYGRPSHDPLFWGLIPSVMDPTAAPPGKHLMSLNIYHAPYHLRGTDWERERVPFGERCIDVLAEYMPGLKDLIRERVFITPTDIEREFGMLEANIMHGDMLPGHLFSLRPLAGCSDYRTPVRGLYLCGSGTWPGGSVTGIPGHNAAHTILADLKRAN